MDSGAENTQKIVIISAVALAIVIVSVIGYSLYTKAKRAEGELANKVALDSQTQKSAESANISLTGEAKNSATFSYDGLVQKKKEEATTTDFGIVNEKVPTEEAVPPEVPTENSAPIEENNAGTEPEANTNTQAVTDEDQPLSQEEIIRIRQLPIDDSPSGQLQTALETESNGQYKARY